MAEAQARILVRLVQDGARHPGEPRRRDPGGASDVSRPRPRRLDRFVVDPASCRELVLWPGGGAIAEREAGHSS